MKTNDIQNIFCLLLMCCSFTLASGPAEIRYQGRLVDGTNLVNGTVAMTLSLYDQNSGGTLLYTDTNASVPVIDGLYATTLGDDTTFGALDSALTNNEVWLEITIDATTLSPRERLMAVPYARKVHGLEVSTNGAVILNPDSGNSATGQGLEDGVIAGGRNNQIAGTRAVIGGGNDNEIGLNSSMSTIGGGRNNLIDAFVGYGTIAGGISNTIVHSTHSSTIGGGADNSVGQNAHYGTIPGGYNNRVIRPYGFAAGQRAVANHTGAFVWGDSTDANISSTASNQVTFRASGGFRVVDGAISGDASGLSNFPSTVIQNVASGGADAVAFSTNNTAAASGSSTLSGFGNEVNGGSTYGTVAGGLQNIIGANAPMTTIAGGQNNEIRTLSDYSAIGGGLQNIIGPSATRSFIGGGYYNQLLAGTGFIGGGYENTVERFSDWAMIGGGSFNIIQSDANAAAIAGGFDNTIGTNSEYSVISGGRNNQVENGVTYAAIGGGWTNEVSGSYSTIGGGLRNIASGADSTIGGGHLNEASGFRSTIPGGSENDAVGDYSFAAGRQARALHDGSMVMADSTDASFSSTSSNQFLIRAQGGVGIGTTSPAAALQVDAEAGENPLRIRSDGSTKLYVQENGGTSIGAFGGASENGLHVAGKTGLGVTDPIERLHVNGGVHIENTIRDISVPVTDNIQMGHYDGTNFTERMRIASDGDVGIGTTPSAGNRLDVNGNVRVRTDLTVDNDATVTDDLTVSGTIFNPLVPIAAGLVLGKNGAAEVISGTGNFSVTRTLGDEYTEISINGHVVDGNYITMITPYDSVVFGAVWYEHIGGNIHTYLRGSDGAGWSYWDYTFSFVTYKLNQ